MRKIVIAGGPGIEIPALIPYMENQYILAADSGANYLYQHQIVPDRVLGDMDSIDRNVLKWAQENNVNMDVFPAEKDMTDSELCLREFQKSDEILFVTSLTGRPDHVLSNLLLSGKLAIEGFSICVTDGTSWVYPICGPRIYTFSEKQKKETPTVSLLPLFTSVQGVTTTGLYYPLEKAVLHPGSSFSVSNCLGISNMNEEVSIRIESGTLLVMLVNGAS